MTSKEFASQFKKSGSTESKSEQKEEQAISKSSQFAQEYYARNGKDKTVEQTENVADIGKAAVMDNMVANKQKAAQKKADNSKKVEAHIDELTTGGGRESDAEQNKKVAVANQIASEGELLPRPGTKAQQFVAENQKRVEETKKAEASTRSTYEQIKAAITNDPTVLMDEGQRSSYNAFSDGTFHKPEDVFFDFFGNESYTGDKKQYMDNYIDMVARQVASNTTGSRVGMSFGEQIVYDNARKAGYSDAQAYDMAVAQVNGYVDAKQEILDAANKRAEKYNPSAIDRAILKEKNKSAFEEAKELTDEERRSVVYLQSVYGKDAAEEYYNAIRPDVVRRRGEKMAKETPVLAWLTSVAENAISGLGAIQTISDKLHGREADPYGGFNALSTNAQAIRSTQREDISKKLDGGISGAVATSLYDAFTSHVDSTVSMAAAVTLTAGLGVPEAKIMAAAQKLSSAVMAAGAFSTEYASLKERGASDTQAFISAFASAITEYATENMFNPFENGIKGLKNGFAKSALGEAFEELVGGGADLVFDSFANQVAEKFGADWETQLEYNTRVLMENNPGMSEKDATWKAFGDMVFDTVRSMGIAGIAGGMSYGASRATGVVAQAAGIYSAIRANVDAQAQSQYNTDAAVQNATQNAQNVQEQANQSAQNVQTQTDAQATQAAQNVQEETAEIEQPFRYGDGVFSEDVQRMAAPNTTQANVNTQANANTQESAEGPSYRGLSDEWATTDNTNTHAYSLQDIVADIKNLFGISIKRWNTGKDALGTFNRRTGAIHTGLSNDVATITHELGHYLDREYGLRKLPSIKDAVESMQRYNPEFTANYKPAQLRGEAIAEFVREYMRDPSAAREIYGNFYDDVMNALDSTKAGQKALADLNKVAVKFRSYLAADTVERSKAQVMTYSEAEKAERSSLSFNDRYVKPAIATVQLMLNERNGLQVAGMKAYNLGMYLYHANGIADGIVSGEYVQDPLLSKEKGTHGDAKAVMRNADGTAVLNEADGTPVYEKSFANVIEQYANQEQMKKDPTGYRKDLNAYLINLHALELGDRAVYGDRSMNNPATYQFNVNAMLKAHPEFAALGDEIARWQRSILYTWGVQTGIVSQELFDLLGEKYKHYVPLHRYVGAAPGQVQTRLSNGQPIQGLRGSGRTIIDPLIAIQSNVQKLVSLSMQNDVKREIGRFLTGDGGNTAVYGEKAQSNIRVSTVSAQTVAEAISKALDKIDVDTVEGDTTHDALDLLEQLTIGDDLSSLFNALGIDSFKEFSRNFQLKPNTMVVANGSQTTYYEITDANLLKSVQSLAGSKLDSNQVFAALRTYANIKKSLTTGLDVLWQIGKNKPADEGNAIVNSIEKNPAKFWGQEVVSTWETIKNDEGFKRYKQSGGGSTSWLGERSKSAEKAISKLMHENPGAVKGFFTGVQEALEKVGEISEQSTRYGEYKRVIDAGGSVMDAILASDNITTNFNETSEILRTLDALAPYTKAGVNAAYNTAKQLTGGKYVPEVVGASQADRKKAAAMLITRKWMTLAFTNIAMAAMQTAWNKAFGGEEDWDKLSAANKNSYWQFYVGGGRFAKVAKPHLYGVPASAMERVYEYVALNDKQAFEDFVNYFVDQLNPVGGSLIIATPLNIWANKNYAGYDIVPASMKGSERLQYDSDTYAPAWALGQLLGLSPKKIEYVLDQETGVIYDMTSWFDVGLVKGEKTVGDAARDVGEAMIRYNYTDSAYSTDEVNRAYDALERYTNAKEDAEVLETPLGGDDRDGYEAYTALTKTLGNITRGLKTDGEIRAAKILARDLANEFSTEYMTNDALVDLYEKTQNPEIFPYQSFGRTFKYEKVDYEVEPPTVVDMWNDYNSVISPIYDDILAMEGVDDAEKVIMLQDAKAFAKNETLRKWAAVQKGEAKETDLVWENDIGATASEWAIFQSDMKAETLKAGKMGVIDEFVDGFGLSEEEAKKKKYTLYAEKYKESTVDDAPWYEFSDHDYSWWDDIWKDAEAKK